MKHIGKKFNLSEILEIANESVEFINCNFTGDNGISLSHSTATFTNCKFEGITSNTLYLENSNCNLINCKVFENGEYGYFASQIFSENSHLTLTQCVIENNKAAAIEVQSGSLNLENCIIKNNMGYALSLSNSAFKIKNCTFRKNYSLDFETNQIILEYTSGNMVNSYIEDCASGFGVFMRADSNLILEKCTIKNNLGGVYLEENSKAKISLSNLDSNKDKSFKSVQVYINGSHAEISQTTIRNGDCGLYCQKGGMCSLSKCKVESNAKGICIFEYSSVTIEDTNILNNLEYPQIYAEESKLFITNSIVQPKNSIKCHKMIDLRIKNSHSLANEFGG